MRIHAIWSCLVAIINPYELEKLPQVKCHEVSETASFSCGATDQPYPNQIILDTQMSDSRRRRLPIQ